MAQVRMRTILVAIADPSSGRQPALRRAAQLAKALGARLIIYHAAFESALSGRPFFETARLARSRGSLVAARTQMLQKRAERLRRAGLDVEVLVVWEDPVHEAIIRAALREKADLVVAGRHERRAGRPPQFRLTDWELMRLCPRPLLVVHPGSGRRTTGAVLAALDPAHAHDKPASLDVSIARYAGAIAHALNVECHAVHCMARGDYPPDQQSFADRKRFDRRMQERMQELAEQAGTNMKSISVLRGSVAQRLPAYTRKLPAQVLAMGIVSRRWLDRFIIGDTAEMIVREVSCDLLLIKPEGFRLRLGRTRNEAIELPGA